MAFQRENRYVVLKIKDIDEALELWEREQLINICQKIMQFRERRGAESLNCVVIEQDWACYDEAWVLVEKEEHDRNRITDETSEVFA